MKKLDISGSRFGRLIAIERSDPIDRQSRWNCLCDCGNTKIINQSSLTSNRTTSCGCFRREFAKNIGSNPSGKRIKHGKCGTREYRAWDRMIQRCTNKNVEKYKNYGGRGVTICSQWIKSFDAFHKDMGDIPKGAYDLDRKDNNKGYSPNNCRWILHKINTQNTSKSKIWFINGEKYKSLSEASKSIGVSTTTIKHWCDGCFTRGRNYKPRPGCYSKKLYN